MIAPTAKFSNHNNIGEIPLGGVPMFTSGVIIIVTIKASESFTVVLIYFLLNTGENLIKPSILAKTIKPAEKYFSNSGKRVAI